MLRKLAELAASQLARYNEVKSYEIMNTEISEETEREIGRGKRILEIFTQLSGVNLSSDEEVLLLYLVVTGIVDKIDVEVVAKLKDKFRGASLSMIKSVEEIKPFADAVIGSYLSKTDSDTAKYFKYIYEKENAPKEVAVKPQEELKPVQAGTVEAPKQG